jgi:hypothetical protein
MTIAPLLFFYNFCFVYQIPETFLLVIGKIQQGDIHGEGKTHT